MAGQVKARLYYELHITCEEGADWQDFADYAEGSGWRASRFDEDLVDNYHGKWFLSARETSMDAVRVLLREMVAALERQGYKVIRWKAEDTLLDSKYGDTL